MERYLSAAERIARWAMSTEIPAKPIEIGYLARESRIRRVDRSTIEAEHRVEFGGDYTVRFGLPGERPPIEGLDAAPVKLGLWMDGKLIATQIVETKPSGLVYFDPYSEEEFQLSLPEGDHVFRAGFIDDEFVQILPEEDAYKRSVEQVPRLDHLHRAVRGEGRQGEPQEDPLVRSPVRPRLRRADRVGSRATRVPPPGDPPRRRFAAAVRGPRPDQRPVRRAGYSARHSGDAGVAELPLPHRARSRSARCVARPRSVAVRAGLARQLLPVELDAGRRAA